MWPQLSAVVLQMLRWRPRNLWYPLLFLWSLSATPLCLMPCEVEWNVAMHVIIRHPLLEAVWWGCLCTHVGFVTELCSPRAGDLQARRLRVSVNGEDRGVGGVRGAGTQQPVTLAALGVAGSLCLLGTRDL